MSDPMGEAGERYHGQDPNRKETIKERIDRETTEQLRKSGRTFQPETQRSASEWNRGPGESYSANVIYDIVSGDPVGAELLKNGEPFYMLKMGQLQPRTDYELQEAYERGYKAAEARFIHAESKPGYASPARPNEMTYTQKAIEDVAQVLGARGHSYTTRSEFENFEDQAALGEMESLRNVFRGMLGQKLTREKSCHARIVEDDNGTTDIGPDAMHALYLQWLDSIRDICGYGLLFFGWAKSEFDSEALRS